MKKQTLETGVASTQSVKQDEAIAALAYRIAQIARYDDRVKFIGATDEHLVHELEQYAIQRDSCVRACGFSPIGFDAAVRANIPERYYPLIG